MSPVSHGELIFLRVIHGKRSALGGDILASCTSSLAQETEATKDFPCFFQLSFLLLPPGVVPSVLDRY